MSMDLVLGIQDWQQLDGIPEKAELDRGNALTVLDPDGNPTTFGFASRALGSGAGGYYCIYNEFGAEFNPAPKGGRIQGLMKRGPSGGVTGSAPMFFIAAQGASVEDAAYLLGLSDSDPNCIILRKGRISEGLPDASVGTEGVLARGTVGHGPNQWHQLRLDTAELPNGDVLLNARQSDIATQGMEDPLWLPIPGIPPTVLDDVLGITTGSRPFTNGRMGFAFQYADVARRAFFTRMTLYQQV